VDARGLAIVTEAREVDRISGEGGRDRALGESEAEPSTTRRLGSRCQQADEKQKGCRELLTER